MKSMMSNSVGHLIKMIYSVCGGIYIDFGSFENCAMLLTDHLNQRTFSFVTFMMKIYEQYNNNMQLSILSKVWFEWGFTLSTSLVCTYLHFLFLSPPPPPFNSYFHFIILQYHTTSKILTPFSYTNIIISIQKHSPHCFWSSITISNS